MEEHFLSKRLYTIANMIKEKEVVADIGCDHAYLSIYLCKKQTASHVYAVDNKNGPLKKAQENIERYRLENQITLIFGDGLLPLQEYYIDTAVIAGMGGEMISDILKKGGNIAKRYLLQPMSKAPFLRRFLYENGYQITAEELVPDAGRIYTILSVIYGENSKKTSVEKQFDYASPALMNSNSPYLNDYLKKQMLDGEKALNNMMHARSKRNDVAKMQSKLEMLRRLLKNH